MSTTPETPFLLTRWSRFTPAFQTDNDDASIGADGLAVGAWYIVSRTLVMQVSFFLAGAGASPGTGNLQIPFPPGYSRNDVDVTRMPRVEDEEGTIEGTVLVSAAASIGGVKTARYSQATLGQTDGVVVADFLEVAAFETLTDGDGLFARIELPLKELALPG